MSEGNQRGHRGFLNEEVIPSAKRLFDKDRNLEIYFLDSGRATNHMGTIVYINGINTPTVSVPHVYHNFLKFGYRVIMIDNRDSGQSITYEPSGGSPDKGNKKEALKSKEDEMVGSYFLRNMLKGILQIFVNINEYSLHDMVHDIEFVIEHSLLPKETFFIVGHSMGGLITQEFCNVSFLESRVQGVVLLSSPSITSRRTIRDVPDLGIFARFAMNIINVKFIPHSKEEQERIINSIYRHQMSQNASDEEVDNTVTLSYYAKAQHQREGGVLRQLGAILKGISDIDIYYPRNLPTLIMHGSDDNLVPPRFAQDLHSRIPGSKLVFLEGVKHGFSASDFEIMVKFYIHPFFQQCRQQKRN